MLYILFNLEVKMIFSLNRNFVVYLKLNGPDIVLESGVTRKDFIDQFNSVDISNITFMNMDYSKNTFHVDTLNNELLVLDNPSQHPLTKFFDDNKDLLANWFTAHENKKNQPSKYHSYNDVNHVWSISAENQINLDKDEARYKRDQLLAESDWTQLSDVTNINKEAWTTYRQALRDITNQNNFPHGIVWPVIPN